MSEKNGSFVFRLFSVLILLTLLVNAAGILPVQAEAPASPRYASGDFAWAKGMGGTSNDFGYSIALDSSGNIYTTGSFQSTADFDPGVGTFNLTSAGLTDIFVSKVDSNGNFVWAKSLGGTDHDAGSDIAVDSSGNVYTTGDFQGTVDFDPGAGTANLTSAGYSDIFVSKLDSNGNFVWAKSMGGGVSDVGVSIGVDSSGNVYTTGAFAGTADFDPGAGTYNLICAGGGDIFVSKLDSSGDFVWAKRMGGTSYDAGSSITVDSSNNVYTMGGFQGTADFDPGAGTANLTSVGDWDIFVSKLDSSGDFVWAKRMGGTSNDYGYGIALDTSSSVYTTGYFYGTVDFDPGAGTSNLTSAGRHDIFISKLDSSGDFIWAKSLGGTSDDFGYGIALDSSGNIYTTGSFQGTADFDPGAGTSNLTSVGIQDIFVSKLDSSGSFVWAKRMGGTSTDEGYSIALDSSGSVYTTGYFQTTADFDPGAGTSNLTSAGNEDIFVSKLQGADVPTVTSIIRASANPTFAANVDFTVTFSKPVTGVDAGDFTVAMTGSVSGTTVSGVAGGPTIYTVTVTTGSGEGTLRLDVTDNDTIQDLTSNPLGGPGLNNGDFTTGEFYTIDTTAPTVDTFTVTTPSNSLNIPVTAFTASDAVGVTGYLITESATVPAAGAAGWAGTAPTTYTVVTSGNYTLYPWAKDAAGNVSLAFGSPRAVVVDTPPTVDTFTITGMFFDSPNIPITAFTATDDVGVTGYLITETSTPPAAGDAGWTGTAPTIFTVSSDGLHLLYPWAKDTAGNVSAAFASPGFVWVADTTAPIVDTFTATTPSNSLNIPITAFTASDAVGVTGYLITESSTVPTAGDSGWTGTAPTTFTVASDGSYTLYPWAKDAADNVSLVFGSPTTVVVDATAPDTTIITKPATLDNDSTPTFTFSGNDGAGSGVASFLCRMDGGAYTACSSPFTSPALVDGSHTFDVYAIDLLGNADASPASHTWTVETISPIITSIARINPSPTNLANVGFTVTFSKPVTGVDMVGPTFDDFSLTTSSGLSGTSVSGVSGSGTIYTITVNSGSGNGTLRLDVSTGGHIVDAALNPLADGFTTGEVYSVIKSATFVDVPLTYWANTFIERLYNAGVTGGCTTNPLNYCPDATVTRAQMAVFLLKGSHGSSYVPPAVGVDSGFSDVPVSYWAAAWIKQLAAEGITGGCGTGIYCPDATVTRAQMAVFLLKAKYGLSYSPPAATGVFTDVPVGYWADKWIEQFAVEGITGGCGAGIYCPDADVTRAQMAVFLVKAFNLP